MIPPPCTKRASRKVPRDFPARPPHVVPVDPRARVLADDCTAVATSRSSTASPSVDRRSAFRGGGISRATAGTRLPAITGSGSAPLRRPIVEPERGHAEAIEHGALGFARDPFTLGASGVRSAWTAPARSVTRGPAAPGTVRKSPAKTGQKVRSGRRREGEEIGPILQGDGGLQTLWHQREGGTGEGGDVLPEDHFLGVDWRARQPEVDTIVRRAGELHAVIRPHPWIKQRGKGNLPAESTPLELAELASRHPGMPLICDHPSGGDWGIRRAIRPQRDVYADLGGSDPVNGEVEWAVRELGADRVLDGSEVAGRRGTSQIGRVLGSDLTLAAKKLILRENLRRLLLPSIAARGSPSEQPIPA